MAFRKEHDLERLTLPAGKHEVVHFDARCPGLPVRIQRTGKPAFRSLVHVGCRQTQADHARGATMPPSGTSAREL